MNLTHNMAAQDVVIYSSQISKSNNKLKVKVLVLSLDPKLALTTSQFFLADHWKWPHSYTYWALQEQLQQLQLQLQGHKIAVVDLLMLPAINEIKGPTLHFLTTA